MVRNPPDLLIFPCSKSKDAPGLPRSSPARHFADHLSCGAAQALADGRTLAFERPRTEIDRRSPLVPALGLYSGHQYRTDDFVGHVLDAIQSGVDCVIVSGGYGLLDALEPIQSYCAHMENTKGVWRGRLPSILRDYVTRKGIKRVFVACSTPYAEVLDERSMADIGLTHWYVPHLAQAQGASQKIPRLIGQAVCQLIDADMKPDSRWRSTPR